MTCCTGGATFSEAHPPVDPRKARTPAPLCITEHRGVSDPHRVQGHRFLIPIVPRLPTSSSVPQALSSVGVVMSIDLEGPTARLIPGAYERNTLTYRQRGSTGTAVPVAVPIGPSSMDAATIAEREREGGGAPRERRRKLPDPSLLP
jgi:hypothetical protein